MMRGFIFPSLLPSDISDVQYYHGVEASSEYFDAVIKRIESLLITRPDDRTDLLSASIRHTFVDENTGLIIKAWREETRKAHQETFWNVSTDIFESAAFYIDDDGAIFLRVYRQGIM